MISHDKIDKEPKIVKFKAEDVNKLLGITISTSDMEVELNRLDFPYELNGDEITVYADSYAQYVEIDSPDSDFVLSDNYFDMNAGSKTVKIVEGTPKTIRLRSVYDID